MESDKNTDGVTERYVVALDQHDAECSHSRHCCNDETPKRAYSQRSAQRVTPATSAIFRNCGCGSLSLLLNSTSHTRSQGDSGGVGAPPGRQKNFFSWQFCQKEAKMGLNLVRCTPADEIKR